MTNTILNRIPRRDDVIPSPPTATYFAHLREGRFMLQRSRSSGEWVYYPRMMAPVSGATDLEWAAPTGRGTVYSATVMHKRPPETNVNLALVDLDEGPRIFTRVEGIPAEQVKIGMRVIARIIAEEDGPLLVFAPGSAMSLRGKVSFVGAATFGGGEMPGYQSIELAAEAGRLAVEDAGLKLSDVDGLFVALPNDFISGLTLAEYYGLHPRFTSNNRTGGSSFLTHTEEAALALDAGIIDVALIAYGSNQRTASGKVVSAQAPSLFEQPYRPNNPVASYALSAARHMYQFGTTAEQLAEVAVSARQWANLNPEAFARGPLTIDDCLAKRLVATPLRVSDCCLVTDGAAAVVMTRADRAKDLKRRPVHLLGAAAAVWHKEISQLADVTVTAAKESGARAFAQAGVSMADIDIVQLYDAFTINTILFLEDLGFCPKGEGGRFVENGRIAPGGELPVNTNGGGLSCTHPGMYGLFTLVEAIRQLRGEAGERQIAGAEIALCHANGGTLSSQATNILGTANVL